MPRQEEVFFNSVDKIVIAGTLLIPETVPSAAALLIAGMGASDRDYTNYFGKKPYKLLAESLVQQGVLVLRVDKRGVGMSSGNFSPDVTSADLAQDVIASINFLKTRAEVNQKQIGLIGHSEGGLIAAMVAKDMPELNFIILLSPAIATSIDAVLENTRLQLLADAASAELIEHNDKIYRTILQIILSTANVEKAEKLAIQLFKEYVATLPQKLEKEMATQFFALNAFNISPRVKFFNSLWYRNFFTYDTTAWFKNIHMPILILNGELDWITSHKIALPLVQEAVAAAGNKKLEIILLPKLNHNLQTCKTGSILEYESLDEAIAPEVIEKIGNWIKTKIKDD